MGPLRTRVKKSFYSIPFAFEACGACFIEGCLLLLRCGLLLLLSLLRSVLALPAALTARSNRTCSGTRSSIIANDLSDYCASGRSANACTRCRARSGRRRLCRRLLRRWIGRIEPCLLDRPRITGRLVALLLFWCLTLRRVYKLLRVSQRDQQNRHKDTRP